MFYKSVLSNMVAPSHRWLLITWNMVSATKDLNYCFYLIIVNLNLNLNSHVQLMATMLDSTAPDHPMIL